MPLILVLLAIAFLVIVLYAHSYGDLQPLFRFPATILAAVAACYLWKRFARTSLFSYAVHAAALGFVWGFYWLFRDELLENRASSTWLPIVLYICMATATCFLALRICRRITPTQKWAAALLVLYPASVIGVTLATKNTEAKEAHGSFFASVVSKVQFNGIAPLNYEIFRYYTSKRTVSLPKTDLKLQSILLSVDNKKPNTALLEMIGKDGQVQYLAPRTVHFDESTFEIEASDNETIDGQLVIISNDGLPYDWDVFYLLPSAYQTLDDPSSE